MLLISAEGFDIDPAARKMTYGTEGCGGAMVMVVACVSVKLAS